jgi:hypothetical protein
LAVWSFVFKETRGKDLHEIDTATLGPPTPVALADDVIE